MPCHNLCNISFTLSPTLQLLALGGAEDGVRGRKSVGRIRVSITIGPGGYVEIASADEPDSDDIVHLGDNVCDGQEILTLCHRHINNPLVTVFSNTDDGRCTLTNSNDTVELKISALTQSRDVLLQPNQPTALGSEGATLCSECKSKVGTKVLIQPSRPCNPVAGDPYTGIITFSVEAA